MHAVGSPAAGNAGQQLPGDLLRLREECFSSADQLLTLRMFDMTPSVESWTYARDHGFDVVAEMGMWIPDLDALLATGLSGPGHTYNHCSGLSDALWRLIADSGAAINMVPRSDSQFGLGSFIPILHANRLGLQEGISCDNELSYGYDMFTRDANAGHHPARAFVWRRVRRRDRRPRPLRPPGRAPGGHDRWRTEHRAREDRKSHAREEGGCPCDRPRPRSDATVRLAGRNRCEFRRRGQRRSGLR